MIYGIIVAGLFGGIVRASVGILKAIRAKKFKKFYTVYFSWTVILSGIIGVFAALIFAKNIKIALLSGYAGIDIVENFIKITKKQV